MIGQEIIDPEPEQIRVGSIVTERDSGITFVVTHVDAGEVFVGINLGGDEGAIGSREGHSIDHAAKLAPFTIWSLAARLRGLDPEWRPPRWHFLNMRTPYSHELIVCCEAGVHWPVIFMARKRDDGEAWNECTPVSITEPRWRGVRVAAREAFNGIEKRTGQLRRRRLTASGKYLPKPERKRR